MRIYSFYHQHNYHLPIKIYEKKIMLGSIYYSSNLKSNIIKQNFLCDDVGINISHLNPLFGQLTGLYWVWKNSKEILLGTETYRLSWIRNNDLYTDDNTLIIPDPCHLQSSIYEQYCLCHGDFGMNILAKESEHNIPIKNFMLKRLKEEHAIHPFNMFICNNNIFNKICCLLFNILFYLYDKYEIKILEYQKQIDQIRFFDFLAERILHIIYTNSVYFIGDIKVKTHKLKNIPAYEFQPDK
jgi:hypothetical protein